MKSISQRTLSLALSAIVVCFVVSLDAMASDPEILQTQQKLQALGYNPGPLDGLWGKKTWNALIRYQRDQGIEATGKLDETTWKRLGIKGVFEQRPKSKNRANIIAWKKLSDLFGVQKRVLNNQMAMRIIGNRFMVTSLQGLKEPLTLAPGRYGGITISRRRGKPPQVTSLIGNFENETPDPKFYSGLGIGSSLVLPDEWIKIFGVRLRGGTVFIKKNGLQLDRVQSGK